MCYQEPGQKPVREEGEAPTGREEKCKKSRKIREVFTVGLRVHCLMGKSMNGWTHCCHVERYMLGADDEISRDRMVKCESRSKIGD